MTLEEAKIILKTYTLPMSRVEIDLYKQALGIVTSSTLKAASND